MVPGRGTRDISNIFFPLLSASRDLFNAAFVSCWSELNEDQQDELIRSIELALTSQDIAEVTQTLLNLAEFMEHSDKVRLCPFVQVEPDRKQVGGEKGPPPPPTACFRSRPASVSLRSGFCSSLGPPALERRQWHCLARGESCQVPSLRQSTALQRTGVPERAHPRHPRVSHQVGSNPFLIAAFL